MPAANKLKPCASTSSRSVSSSSSRGASPGGIVPLIWPGGGFPHKELANPALATTVEAAFVHATHHLMVKRRMVCRPAVVLDIDDTALIGPDSRQKTHSPVHAFYRAAIAEKVDVFFVTARSEKEKDNREETVQQLRDCGYAKFTELLMAPRYTAAFTDIKRSHRRAIEKMGFEILVNAGDQWADLVSDKVPETVLRAVQAIARKKPFVFYNGVEGGTLCIKLWS
jgi:HAD superfamily, subfamily IIIB (Acid phosphatase)